MLNFVFKFKESSEDKTYELFQAVYGNPHDSVLKSIGVVGYLKIDKIDSVLPGETYTLPAYKFHDSVPVGFTATIMTKKVVYSTEKPCTIAVPLGVQPDNEFKRDKAVPQSILFGEIKKFLTNYKNCGIMANIMNLKETINVYTNS
jgi:hypothetical protein